MPLDVRKPYALPEAEEFLLCYARFRNGVLKIIEIEPSHFGARSRSVGA
jgi:hypothetical protein